MTRITIKTGRQILIIVSVLFFLISIAYAVNYPKLTDFVTDKANIIGPAYETKITELAKKIEQETTVEIAVVTVSSLDEIDIETYAVELFEEAGIGKKDLDNGLLVLIAPNERKYRIEVGYGLEGTIPDIRAREIGVNVLAPNFKNNEFGKGVYDALAVVYGYLTDNEEVISKYHSVYVGKSRGIGLGNILYLVFIFFIFLSSILGAIFGKRRRHRMGFFPVIIGGFGGGFAGGGSHSSGFGGFGGGFSGGGGASGGW